jgi:hypothetical protein
VTIAFVSDVHLGSPKQHGGAMERGVNRRGRLVLGALTRAVMEAQDRKCDTLVSCGDLFDSAKPEPQLIREAQHIFEAAAKSNIDVVALLGNHEMTSEVRGDNSLAPLLPVADVSDSPALFQDDGLSLLAIPFKPGPASEWLPRVVAAAAKDFKYERRVLVVHLGIQDGSTPPWLQGAHDSIHVDALRELMHAHGFTHAFAGNWHEPKLWEEGGLTVCQVGCLAPTGWNNPGLGYGTMAFLHDGSRKGWSAGDVEVIPVPGPRFVSNAVEARRALSKGCQPYMRRTFEPSEEVEARAEGAALVEEDVVVELIPDATEAKVAMSQASGAAREATTVDAALAAYVGQMPLEDPELRQDVLAKVRSFMAGGAP